ncbi:MAG: SMP-30/gluconolactonase/LRE family protein, partial [Caldimonas manganoxidans]|nr:SMP-30/gluconolactonase/LRE family protein [Caldimonas manganoxidans]
FRTWRGGAGGDGLGGTDVWAIAQAPDGAIWVGTFEGGLNRVDPAQGVVGALRHRPGDATSIAGDIVTNLRLDARGRLWVGTIYEPRDPALAALYCLDETGRLSRRADGITVSNGLAWSPDARTMYWSDTKAHTIYAFDYDPTDGSLGPRRVFARFEPRGEGQPLECYGGRPDGAAMDAEGCYWVAMFEGARVLRLSPQGEVLHELRLPVRCPTMPCFGGADLRTLYITTARDKRPAEELAAQPWAGCVLQVRVEVPGLAAAACQL